MKSPKVPILPIRFMPLYQERVWGGRSLEEVYGRALPKEGVPYGESWELADRPEGQSVVVGGQYAGKSLNALWREQREEIFGDDLKGEGFPLLFKILDAREDLSIQVHPPAEVAAELGGEAKTEMWYVVAADEGAKLYVGVREGVTRQSFEQALADGTVAEQVGVLEPQAGDSLLVRSGRLHAIGAGLFIYEIQQNSDTTYRVFDWNRMGLDGKPRDLHVEESLRCIDFDDVGVQLHAGSEVAEDVLADCKYFCVMQRVLAAGVECAAQNEQRFAVWAVVEGGVSDCAGRVYRAGDFVLLPRGASALVVGAEGAKILETSLA